ncbi:ATP-dependent helicase HrpB [Litoribacillus peritrichatus]|uniref:ATP-dependent helicase HrpB n=1 Tax=Litoribacillus peritrichatus TaxID=718191 RepID=A0ABP7M801_9GAMM
MPALPIEAVIPDIKSTLMASHQLILEAPPGAGKTTLVPLALLGEPWLEDQKIILLEPRRIAARAAAERMAQLIGESVGETVGYRVRMDSKVSQKTQIEVVTEGILNRMLQDDPSLEGIGLIIFDEFHERSLDGDLGLALALQGRELFGELRTTPLKLLIMSATLDGANISELLSNEHQQPAPVIRSEGRAFPIDILYGQPYQHQNASYGDRITDRVAKTILQALEEQTGSLLVFLPGQGEIREVQKLISPTLSSQPGVIITPLFGSLSLSEQRKAIEPAQQNTRKVVLTTSIAETSLTIEGVRVVIDSGLSRLPEYDPKTAMTRLKTARVSKASAKQRAGRAGRTEPGVCYRLWSEDQQHALANYTAPEIEQADLTPLALQLLNWGIDNPAELSWLTPPASSPFQQALDLLVQLDAVEQNRRTLTQHGEVIAKLPVHPRLGHMIIKGNQFGHPQLACQIAALLSERDPLSNDSDTDLSRRLELLSGERAPSASQTYLIKRIDQLAKQFLRNLKSLKSESQHQVPENNIDLSESEATGILIALAYPDRIAKKLSADSQDCKLSNGRQASLPHTSKHNTFAIAQLGGALGTSKDRVYLSAPVSVEQLKFIEPSLFNEQVEVDWCTKENRLIAEKQWFIGKLKLATSQLNEIPTELKNKALLQLVQNKGLDILPWTPELKSWCQRIELLRASDLSDNNKTLWPDMSEAGLMLTMENWLMPFLDGISHINHFKKLNLKDILTNRLPWPLPQHLDELAPERIKVPSGSSIRIDYTQNPPVLAVKLQEMFGQTTTPSIAKGRIKLLVHLLSPAQRPLQVTQDLEGFWQSSYELVKKDMKGRYPKHHWPDNPLEAEATARTKPRKK